LRTVVILEGAGGVCPVVDVARSDRMDREVVTAGTVWGVATGAVLILAAFLVTFVMLRHGSDPALVADLQDRLTAICSVVVPAPQ
jgi:hypothetical protein